MKYNLEIIKSKRIVMARNISRGTKRYKYKKQNKY